MKVRKSMRNMVDTITPKERSKIMSKVKSRNTTPELKLRKLLFSKGYRYRLNYPLSGKPDIVFVSKKTVIFVDGCFWHGCEEHCRMPSSNEEYWEMKIQKNMDRDLKVKLELIEEGWRVIRIWEHDIKVDLEKVVEELVKILED